MSGPEEIPDDANMVDIKDIYVGEDTTVWYEDDEQHCTTNESLEAEA